MTIELDNKQQAISFRDDIAEKVDGLLDTAADESFFALQAVRAAVVKDINIRVANLPALLIYQPPEVLPAVVVAHNLYYDSTRETEVVARNNPKNPGFVANNVEYLK